MSSEILCVDSYVGIKEIFKKRQQNILNSEETKNIEDNKAGGTKLVRLETKAAAELVSAGEFDKEMTEESCENIGSDIRNDTTQSFTSCMKRQHQVTKNAIGEYQASKCTKHENETTPSRSKTLLYSKPTPRKRKQLSNSDELKFGKKL